MENFGLDQEIDSYSVADYIAKQLENIEAKEVEIEKEKVKISFLKQLNNHSRLRLDAAKFALKKAEMELAEKV